MSKSTPKVDPLPFYMGQLHALKAFAHALIHAHHDTGKLLEEFQASSDRGLDQIRGAPVPHGAIRAYQQLCDELVVALARQVRESIRVDREIILLLLALEAGRQISRYSPRVANSSHQPSIFGWFVASS